MGLETNGISVVIATLGGETLIKTIDLLNHGSIQPSEILISIPQEYVDRVSDLGEVENVKIVPTSVKGQVAQRVEGFKKVQFEKVLQMDDDIYVEKNTLEVLSTLLLGLPESSAISPALIYADNGQSVYTCFDQKNLTSFSRLLHGVKHCFPGAVSLVGYNFEMNIDKIKGAYESTEWLPGGCVLHWKKNLFLENYYPLPGKATEEDVIHSTYLIQKGLRLYITSEARVALDRMDFDYFNLSFDEKKAFLDKQFETRRLIVRLRHGSFFPVLLLLPDQIRSVILGQILYCQVITRVF